MSVLQRAVLRTCKTFALGAGIKQFQKLSNSKNMEELAEHIIDTCDMVAAAPLERLEQAIQELKQEQKQQNQELKQEQKQQNQELKQAIMEQKQAIMEQKQELTAKLGLLLVGLLILVAVLMPDAFAKSPLAHLLTKLVKL